MPVKLHRCKLEWLKTGACWRVEKALKEMKIEYELAPGTFSSEQARGGDRSHGTEALSGDRIRERRVVPGGIARHGGNDSRRDPHGACNLGRVNRSAVRRFGTIRRYGAWRSLVSAPVWGTGGPEFESRRPDESPAKAGFFLGEARAPSRRGSAATGSGLGASVVEASSFAIKPEPDDRPAAIRRTRGPRCESPDRWPLDLSL